MNAVPTTTARIPLAHGRVELTALNTNVLKLYAQEGRPLIDFVGMGDAEYRIKFVYAPPDDRSETLIADIVFPLAVDLQLCTGEFAASSFDVPMFNRQTRVLHNAIKEMNALYNLHSGGQDDPHVSDEDTSGKGPKLPLNASTLGEFIGGALRGFTGMG